MKQLFIITIIELGLTSCEEQCFQCDNGQSGQWHSELEVCPDHAWYDDLEDGQVFTDNVGNVYTCTR